MKRVNELSNKAKALALVAFALFLCGCSDEKNTAQELKELRKDIAQLRGDIRELRNSVDRREKMDFNMRRAARMDHMERSGMGMTNGIPRMPPGRPMISREEMEARRKMMQDPELRKKFEAEHKARMEERRRLYEERRREMEERRRSNAAPATDAPAKK